MRPLLLAMLAMALATLAVLLAMLAVLLASPAAADGTCHFDPTSENCLEAGVVSSPDDVPADEPAVSTITVEDLPDTGMGVATPLGLSLALLAAGGYALIKTADDGS